MILDDNSIWEVVNPPFETQSWWEWLNGQDHIQPVNQIYFQLSQWQEQDNTLVQIYEWKMSETSVANSNKFFQENQILLSTYPYLMENLISGEMVFCRLIKPSELVHLLNSIQGQAKIEYNRGYEDGYKSGYRRGYLEGRNKH